MQKSETIAKIAAALCAANSEIENIAKNAENPHFKSKYADLANILEEIRPVLSTHKLFVMQDLFCHTPGTLSCATTIMHESGEWMTSEPFTCKLSKDDPQGAGSGGTYARRYSLSAFLSLGTEVDDDGNKASEAPKRAQDTANTPARSNSAPPPSNASGGQVGGNPVRPISPAQIGLIKKMLLEKKIPDDMYRTMLKGYGVAHTTELSSTNASAVIKRLESYQPEPVEEPLPF
ncbi:ERF family protein [Paenibacillus sp. RUD330]|uniref:ERF family protein n=1 Tax=Paenibacillus sp. RUD330 TaxID=2023772 RepID=UPI000B92CDC5|nr:ERF family protein [Paenibacillus sp. RUD330]ASS66242.1 recombinase [Paenibacillus sp. RUD330]